MPSAFFAARAKSVFTRLAGAGTLTSMKAEIILSDFIFIDGDREVLADMRDDARKNGIYRLRGVQTCEVREEYSTESGETFYEIKVTVRQRGMDGDESKFRIYLALPEEMCEKLSTAWQHYKENKTFFKYDTSACRLNMVMDEALAAQMSAAVRELQVSDNPKCGCRAAELFAFSEA